ncbi:hypothetical protein SAMN05660649_02182 [Desulfotomaculum arcticum]|uniref:Uncharacterized protein n=1 Tax=Desulfotruncus arcticus DSM 17038 TaxID=1121424 RepID=A0A1I2TJY8_9FIRM|nr:hypothetical protein [Desulfotruncus arcticus]SFG62806.1 hypothetical protein SAMN05660649_02182 [Desulfotomaculum arcticum] [Desulfotruncus arcticus DSM 17038]
MDPQSPVSTLPGIYDPRSCYKGIPGRVRPRPLKDDPDKPDLVYVVKRSRREQSGACG